MIVSQQNLQIYHCLLKDDIVHLHIWNSLDYAEIAHKILKYTHHPTTATQSNF